MNDENSAYFRQRAEYHLNKAAQAERGVACIHRLFAQSYAVNADKSEMAGRAGRAELRHAPSLRSRTISAAIPNS